ncbi:MAG TPA: cache domain-containing protein [Bryobacteraceae bacterium]|jgi:hypothetical protein|nr:cache domain-containing protein [Bryobacteraceae bacterium]
MDRMEVRISLTKLLLALIVTIVPLSILGLALTQRSDKSIDSAVGSNFRSIAQLYATQVNSYIRERLTDVGLLSSNPAVIAAASAKAGAKGNLDEEASAILRQHKSIDPRFLSITVTNADANVVASSQKPAQTSFAQDAHWQAVYNNGQGATKISDIIEDEITKSDYVNLGVPILGAQGQTVGVLNAQISLNDLLTPFRQNQLEGGAKAALVNDDGMIVSGPNADVFARLKMPEFDYVHDALGANHGAQNGWVMASGDRGDAIVGYAGTGLKKTFPNMAWVVTVTQDEHQASAPIRLLERFAIIMVILALFMLTLLGVYYYLHRAQRYGYIEEESATPETRGGAAASAHV